MLPQITIFGKIISTYSLCGIIGILVAAWIYCYLLKRRNRCDSDGILMILFSGIGILIGSHLLYGITNIKYWHVIFEASSFKEVFSILESIFGGAVFYGGLIGGLIFAFIYIRLKKLDFNDFADCGAISIPLFHSFARVGCFLAGCCYGIESEFGFMSNYNPLVPAVVGIRRFPTSLLEALLNLALFFVLLNLRKSKRLRGALLHIYLISYSVMRFAIEFLRGDEIRGIWFGLSTSQWISIVVFVFSAHMLHKHQCLQKTKKAKSNTST
ncbi:MAG: prolipoprotein diacylglyceryl transferase [Clostridia bacterium]|nr:prolipoprotein diacylglyceryl transferase [Clostridia bacterium]